MWASWIDITGTNIKWQVIIMYQFFVTTGAIGAEQVKITGQDVNHIKNVLRLKSGAQICISDNTGREYTCRITELTCDTVFAKIEDVQAAAAELPVEIYLFQGYPKGDKLETIIQKTVELGVARIIPVMTKRSIVKLDEKKAIKKQERFQAIALAAAKQAKRGVIPEVMPVMSFEDAIQFAKTLDMVLIPYENAEGVHASKSLIQEIHNHKSLGIFIGPEGGFDPAEVDRVKDIGGHSITLGHRILRTETAGMTMMSIIMFELEDELKKRNDSINVKHETK